MAATAFPVLPLELGLGRVALAVPLAVLFLLLAVSERGARFPGHGVRVALAGMAAWAFLRLLPLSALYGEATDSTAALRESVAVLAALGAFHIGTQERYRPAIRRGLVLAFAAIVGLTIYQTTAGLDALLVAGYRFDTGFYYYTLAGDMRPFGLFTGPTTFATFALMVGACLAITAKGWRIWAYALATLGVVIATETRAALLAAAAVFVAAALTSPRVRSNGPLWLFGPAVALVSVVFTPGIYATAWERLMSATDVSDRSRSTRTELWAAVIDVTHDNGAVLDGMGNAPWTESMSGRVSSDALALGHAHSNFFQQWYFYGLIGVALFALLLVCSLTFTLRAYRQTGSAYALAGLAAALIFMVDSVFNNSLSSVNYLLLTMLLIGSAGGVTRGRPSSPSRSGRASTTPRSTRTGTRPR